MSEPIVTERIVFHGRVQGVGFRATTHALAARRPIAGYVRNQPDGSVELVAQGTPEAIDELLKAIAARFPGSIQSLDREKFDTAERFTQFEVR